ncbi:MAG TPA: hypothetical protein VHD76_21290 [Bryobacteraceae bacterium]|jgi:hypothetical protein|nr:hypothetical protein [Bryobacteraceae bacterium]
MSQVASVTTNKLGGLLTASTGLPAKVASLSASADIALAPINISQIVPQNVSPEIAERALATRYPSAHIYCEKVVNLLREKFRGFSGEAHMVVELRVSQDRLEGLETQTQLYVEAVTNVLDANRGDWGGGMFHGGGYEVSYGTVKKGGRNLLQSAKISFVLQVSLN